MQRLFNRDFHKSYFSLSQAELQALHTDISSYHFTDAGKMIDAPLALRKLLTAIPSLQFKVNNANLPLAPIVQEALSLISKRLGVPTPTDSHLSPLTSPPSSPKGGGREGASSHLSPLTSPLSSPKGGGREGAPNGGQEGASSLNSLLPYLPPLLRSEAMSVQELYYIPRAQIHDRLYDNVATALTRFAASDHSDQEQRTILGADSTRQSLAAEIEKYDNRINNFWSRIHWYQDQLNGNNPDPDLLARLEKAAHRLGCSVPSKDNVDAKPLGSYTRQEIEGGLAMVASGASLEELKSARILRNKKLLNRRDRQRTDAHRLTIEQAINELHEWGIPIERGQQATAEYYGYQVPTEWLKQQPTPEEKAAAHNAAVKKSYAKKHAIEREMKAAFEAEAKAQFKPLDKS